MSTTIIFLKKMKIRGGFVFVILRKTKNREWVRNLKMHIALPTSR
jgi:hypothetical protein